MVTISPTPTNQAIAEAEEPSVLVDSLVAEAGTETAQMNARNTVLLPMIIGVALFMGTLDGTVISNALPTMARSLHRDPLTLNLAITSYLLASAVFLPISGWAADRFGAKGIFRAAIFMFALASVFCGLSTTLTELVLARMLQGMAGSMMLPVGRLVLLKVLPKSEMVRAMSYLILPGVMGTVLGPPLGGFIVTFSSWRWIFYMNIPIAILGIVLTTLFVPNIKEAPAKLDVKGFVLTGLGLAMLVYGTENIGRGIFPASLVAGLVLGGLACAILFWRHAKGRADAILDIGVFDYPTYMSATVGGMFLRLALGAGPFLTALLLQIGFGLTAFQAGSLAVADALGSLLTMKSTQPLVRRFGFRKMLSWNLVASAILQATYTFFTPKTPHWQIVIVFFVAGMFRSTLFAGLNGLTFADVPQAQMSRASSFASVCTQLAASIGVGLAAVLLHTSMKIHGSSTIQAADITALYPIISLIPLIALVFLLRLPSSAGSSVSGVTGTPALIAED